MIFWLYCAFPRLRFIQSAYESSLFSEELFSGKAADSR